MKNIINYFIIATLAITLASLTSCQNLDENPSPYSDMAMASAVGLNISNFVQNNHVVANSGESVTFIPAAPFQTRVLPSGEYTVANNGFAENGNITVTMNDLPNCDIPLGYNGPYSNIPGYAEGKGTYNLTRDILITIYQAEFRNVEGYGRFEYPIRIRQLGKDGTYYLSAEEINNYKSVPLATIKSAFGYDRQRYIKGVIKSNDGLKRETIKAGQGWSKPWIKEGTYYVASDFDKMDFVVTSEGTDIKVRLEYLSQYHLFDNFTLNVGDTVEICVREVCSGKLYDDETGGYAIVATPLDIYKK